MSVPASYFDGMYARSDDPWGFRTRWYEVRKRSLLLASLQSEHYSCAFEPGCSIGATTACLSSRVDHLLAMDVSTRALDTARAAVPRHVEFVQGQVPRDWPDGRFDLVVVSELAYYLGRAECERLADLASRSTDELVVIHWRHPVDDYPLGGDDAQELFTKAALHQGLEHLVAHREPDFLIDSWCRDRRSPATRAGLVP
jgi:Nodulation protein S (NodS)